MINQSLPDISVPLLQWYRQNARVLPWRSDPTPYKVWVSEVMLQQTRVEAVKPYFERFMQALPTISSLADAEEQTLLKLWEGLGYYSRVRNLQKAAKIVMSNCHGEMPRTPSELIKLPGIGPYTAGAIASIAYQYKAPAVDGNVLRVVTRLLSDSRDILSPSVKKDLTQKIEKILPDEIGAFNQALMELGAVICLPNGAPKCENCPVRTFCTSFSSQTQLQYPVKTPKKERKIEQKTVFLFLFQHKVAVCKRPPDGLLANLWGYPMADDYLAEEEVLPYLLQKNYCVSSVLTLQPSKHIFTHLEWHMACYAVILSKPPQNNTFFWSTRQELRDVYPIPSAYKKITKYLLETDL